MGLRLKGLSLLLFFLLVITFSQSLADENGSSFWSKTDKFLKKGADFLSKEDKITGLRSLNLVSDEEARKRGLQNLHLVLD